jgi:Cof subfamily protein (haloacid dehalogenase superfamily)
MRKIEIEAGDKMKKILFTDLDGTLLNNDKQVSDGNRAAIQRLLDAGHYLVVSTGRPVKSGFKVVQRLGLTMPGCYMIAYNGGTIFDCSEQKILTEKTFPLEYVQYLFKEANEYGIHIQTYGEDDKVLTTKDSPELQYYLKGNRNALDYEIHENVCELLVKDPYKVLLINMDEEKLLDFRNEHQEWAEGKCESTFSSRQLLEYLPKGVNKGSGVRMLCEMLEVKIENTYAAGDERNDISMIETAGVGIAMKNAVDEVKAVADYITENDNDHDGIAEVIDKLIL